MSRATWTKTLQWCVQTIVATACVVTVLLLTASSPDMDEVTRGIPSGIVGAFGGWLSGRVFPKG